jgi:hypothetical protein
MLQDNLSSYPLYFFPPAALAASKAYPVVSHLSKGGVKGDFKSSHHSVGSGLRRGASAPLYKISPFPLTRGRGIKGDGVRHTQGGEVDKDPARVII